MQEQPPTVPELIQSDNTPISRTYDPATYDVIFPPTEKQQDDDTWLQLALPSATTTTTTIKKMKEMMMFHNDKASERYIKMLNDLYRRDDLHKKAANGGVSLNEGKKDSYYNMFLKYSKSVNSMNQMEAIFQGLNQMDRIVRDDDETGVMTKISLSKRMIKQLQESEVQQFGDSIKVSDDDQEPFDQSKYLELLRRLKFHEICVNHNNQNQQSSTQSDSLNNFQKDQKLEDLYKRLVESEQVQNSIKQRKKIKKIIKKGKLFNPSTLINLNALKTAIQMEEKTLEKLKKRKRLCEYQYLETQIPKIKSFKMRQKCSEAAVDSKPVPYFISNALLSNYQEITVAQQEEGKEQLQEEVGGGGGVVVEGVEGGEEQNKKEDSIKQQKDTLLEQQDKRQKKIKLITSLCMNTFNRAEEQYFNPPIINSLLQRRPAQIKSSEFMQVYSNSNKHHRIAKKKKPIQLGFTPQDFYKLPQYNPSYIVSMSTNNQTSSPPDNSTPDQANRLFPQLLNNYLKFDFPDGIKQSKYFSSTNALLLEGKTSSQQNNKVAQGATGADDKGGENGNSWTYSFIQNSSRDTLLNLLSQQMQRQTQKVTQSKDDKDDTTSNIGGGGNNNEASSRPKQQQPIITVGGVKLDKIVMKVNVISKSAKKTSKMLRGAEIKKGKFKLQDTGLAPGDDQQLKKHASMVYKREILKMMKYYQKYKTDKQTFCKRMVTHCAKQFRKKALKRVKAFKEHSQRAKKLAKFQQFWKRQDRELVDAKKKKEKYIKEIKRQEQERKEAQLQEKRFKFLLRQSTVYADFMARKMGVQRQHGIQQTKLESNQQEKRAKVEVSAMINQHKQRIASYDNKSAELISPDDLLEVEKNTLLDGGQAGQVVLRPPRFFQGTLKEYQLKGLSWLVNLYQQGINGILADQMGLGKTVQAISLLAHICDTKNQWGPFLVCAPTTTLHSWLQEVKKFCPALQVMPYWGSQPQRKTFRQYFRPKSLGQRDSIFHILVTSYQLAVSDQKYLQRIKWKYIVLDQAQAIKNFLSVRWKTLLNYDSRNRLLLTGTPIQNSMAQLWALLHFIMPALFSKHDDFQQWFSKDIQAHSRNQGTIDNAQLQKLHAVLKPFMLRRVKKDVEHELPPKQQFDLLCEMSSRQRQLYKMVKQKVPISQMFQMAQSKFKLQNLMNLIMQFRKVCNHPELFERHFGISPYMFKVFTPFVPLPSVYNCVSGVTQLPYMKLTLTNPIQFYLPKIIIEDLNMTDYVEGDRLQLLNFNGYYQKQFKRVNNRIVKDYVKKLGFGIRKAVYQRLSIFNLMDNNNPQRAQQEYHDTIIQTNPSYVETIAYFLSLTTCELRYIMQDAPWLAIQIGFKNYYQKISNHAYLQQYHGERSTTTPTKFNCINNLKQSLVQQNFSIFNPQTIFLTQQSILYHTRFKQTITPQQASNDPHIITISRSISHLQRLANLRYSKFSCFPKALAAPIFPTSESIKYKSSISFYFEQNTIVKRCLHGCSLIVGKNPISLVGSINLNFNSTFIPFKKPTSQEMSQYYKFNCYIPFKIYHSINEYNRQLFPNTIQQFMYPLQLPKSFSKYELPDFNRLVQDSGKLKLLDDLLKRLYNQGHRTLIFCQMTKMLDILQQFLTWRKYTYLRMDGSSVVSDRRDMVDQFQRNENLFAFLLSTRAGGLGVTLTAADTVIFYDSDWNPTMDAQATDRVHRIGQTKEVKVFRLMTKGTVEERIIKRAQQKQTVQSTVYAGGALKGELFKSTEVVGLLMDDEDQANQAELKEMSKLTDQSMSYSNKQQRNN